MKRKIISLIALGLGVFVLSQVILPPLAFKIWEISTLDQNATLLDPTSVNQVQGVSIEEVGNFPAFVSNNVRKDPPPYSDFRLSIPSIGLSNIKVLVDSNSFEQSLAQLPGTAMPGEKGNLFITGHSSLTFLYSPTNFSAIFSNLPKIKKGDLISIDALGHFDYIVEGMRVVDPSEVSVINPPDTEGRYLSLMTCVPPGFNSKRLIVLAKLK